MAASVVLYGGLALIATSMDLPVLARRAVWAVAVVIAVGVGFSRVYRGLHHPTDVVAGAALGIGCLVAAVAVSRLLPSGYEGRRPMTERSKGTAMGSAGAAPEQR